MTTTTVDPLAYYAAHGCALFPIPAGSKAPVGIVASFKHDHSTDPAQWNAWRTAHPGCNFGVVAFASRLIIADVDTAKIGRDAAWAVWVDLCASWGLPAPLMPHVQSARLGWHIYLSVPPDVDPATLRQPDAIKDIINIRCVGFTVAAGSYFNDEGTAKPYLLLSDAAPYPAPLALLEFCRRRPAPARSSATPPGSLDPGETAKLITWLTERGTFAAYEDWVAVGMATKLEFGDAGFPLWELTFDETVTPDTAASKWDSFATEPNAHSVTILTFLQRAHKAGWKGSIGRTAAAMFSGVAAMAAAAGATLASAPGGSLIGNTQKLIADLGQPILETFFDTTNDVPLQPHSSNFPQILPDGGMNEHALFDAMNTAIRRIVAMAETPKSFRQQRVVRVLSVLNLMHEPTYKALVDRINGLGCALSPNNLATQNKQFEIEVIRATNGTGRTSFHTDTKNKPDPAISDNVAIFLSLSDHRVRFDTFPKRAEVAKADDEFARFDQDELDRLWMLAKSADYNYHPARDMFRSALKVEARRDRYDSLEDKVYELARKWDGVPRLDNWLSRCVNVVDDAYHRAVGRNLIGGMVRRARYPGCVQSETVIFISPEQGTGKSTLCRILAMQDDWFLGSYKFGGTQQSSLPLLAGKWVVELGELAGLNKTDFEDVKTFLSETKDEYVAKYESEPTENMRRCVFIGTSNIRQPLADPSGNRRFLPVHVIGEIDLEWLRQNVEQLIGEAAVRDEKGESFGIPREIWTVTTAAQEAARNMSPIEETCHIWFDRQGSFYILAGDLANAFRMAGLGANVRVGVFMEKMGWRRAQVGPNRDRVWIKHPNNNVVDCIQMIPAQQTTNGRVDMRILKTIPPCPVGLPPPLPVR